jgi:hypothetical protein
VAAFRKGLGETGYVEGIHSPSNVRLRFLTHLGSRIVFLIDWNRMRKRPRAPS